MQVSYKQMEDELIQRCIENNRLAQKQLYERFYGKFLGVCMRYASNRDQAIEILNLGFFKIFKQLERFAGGDSSNFEGWMYRIMVNTAIDFIRAESRHQFQEMSPAIYAEDNSDIVAALSAEQILEVVQKLTPAYRSVFNLYVVEGYNHREIGELLGISEGTSKSNLAKARGKLQQMITALYKIDLSHYGKQEQR